LRWEGYGGASIGKRIGRQGNPVYCLDLFRTDFRFIEQNSRGDRMRGAILAGVLAVLAPAAFAQSTGPYAGVQVGYAAGGADLNLRIPGDPHTYADSLDYDGWDAGVFAGYRYMFPNDFFLGGEIGGSWANADGSTDNAFGFGRPGFDPRVSLEKSDEYYLSLKAGGRVTPRALVYLIGGVQMAGFEGTQLFVTNAGMPDEDKVSFRNDSSINGLHVGVGGEYFVRDNVSGRFEAKYQDYDTLSVRVGGDRVKFNPDEAVFRLGVSYNF
jgi:opacity protein-like surface antigen